MNPNEPEDGRDYSVDEIWPPNQEYLDEIAQASEEDE